ncbi:MAG: fasciclin domain-containing protein [Paludibacter sp.]|nr:fasciclin domain-containing protein [Paludibacter sp.]
MKKALIYLFVLILIFSSCNDKWDDYYNSSASEEELSQTLTEFFTEHIEYSEFYNMIKQTGLDAYLNKDQELTVWVVNNTNMEQSGIEATDTLRMEYHINHLPFIRSDLKTGLRIQSLNGIYFQITKKNDSIWTNSSRVLKSFRLKNGVVHEINSLMKSRINMYDYLKQLDDDYSIIRDSIFKYNVQLFDKSNSIPIGVDKTGNTLYDSAFYVYNPLFERVEFNSEFKQFTAFVPSNEVITNCFEALAAQYAKMGKTVTQSDTLLAMQWIEEAMFYNGELTDFSAEDIHSAFGRVWRTTVQEINEDSKVELSNGLLYDMKKVKIPNNVIISRIKSLVEYWQYQDKVYPDASDLYVFKGVLGNPSIYVGDATPKPAILPNYILLQLSGDPDSNDEFSVEFPPLEKYEEDGKTKVRVMEVPTGEYTLYMGFRSSAHPYVNVYFNGELIKSSVQASLSTPYNYDRVNETAHDLDPVNGTKKWDGLGGAIGTVTIPGDGMASFRIKVEFDKLESAGAKKTMQIYHWTLKPTENNY